MVSIIIPVYNAEAYLDRCIGSVVAQTYPDIEIILVNDGSTDGSLRICEDWQKKDGRIVLISQQNRGVSAARNAGLAVARGSHVMMLDSDDYFDPDACDLMLGTMREKDADCVICGLNQTHGFIWRPQKNADYASAEDFRRDFAYWLNTELLSTSVNKIYKKSKILSCYPEGQSFGEDLIFSLNYLKGCDRISFITAAPYRHEVFNMHSLTHGFNVRRFDDLERIQECVRDFAGGQDVPYAKYVKDAVHLIRGLYKADGYSSGDKKKILGEWFSGSFLKNLKIKDMSLGWRDRILLGCLYGGFYLGVNLVVNGKSMIRL